ncbi:MAG TPA: AraC family transcriptional regulator, partial [Cupriavidus sp.]|nr:AraC family transcriptional regulator [Cupriavidus sp.]
VKERGFLHVLREGHLTLSHSDRGLPRRMEIREPSLLFYPRHVIH